MILPTQTLADAAKNYSIPSGIDLRVGGLTDALADADLAITKTGTITMECAYFGVPAVTLYKPTWLQYQIGKRIIKIRTATMPNILAGEALYPEFVEKPPTPENIAAAALELLRDASRRQKIQAQLARVISSLGGPGASRRAADAILRSLSS
jgi:lipid-A-disaccharide synthase